ncbi:MAG: type II secretion system protein [Clostridia bacterium]|nr:type II secretion system protein [Clostridia bacterium]
MKRSKKGFTIVELVIVIAVIGILAAVLIPTFSYVVKKANQSVATQELQSALTEYISTTEFAALPDGTVFYYPTDKQGADYASLQGYWEYAAGEWWMVTVAAGSAYPVLSAVGATFTACVNDETYFASRQYYAVTYFEDIAALVEGTTYYTLAEGVYSVVAVPATGNDYYTIVAATPDSTAFGAAETTFAVNNGTQFSFNGILVYAQE